MSRFDSMIVADRLATVLAAAASYPDEVDCDISELETLPPTLRSTEIEEWLGEEDILTPIATPIPELLRRLRNDRQSAIVRGDTAEFERLDRAITEITES